MENIKLIPKKKSFDNINKMPRLSKNQKVRRDTQKLLDEIKSKLNPRTFTSLKGDIQEKRIDAVKRIADKLKTLKDSLPKLVLLKKHLANQFKT
jgi:ferritin